MAITTHNGAFQNRAKGQGYRFPFLSVGTTGTAAAAASGFINLTLLFNTIGSVTPTTLQTIPLPAGLPNELYPNISHYQNTGNSSRTSFKALLYKLGTLDLANAAATPYDGFTHNANFTGPLTRTLNGISTNIQMIPVFYLTVITSTTAPAFILQATTGPGAGYKNQANASVTGTKTFTLPNIATAAGSTYILRLEDGDSAITDMTQISVTTKSSGSPVATIFGVEFLAGVSSAAAYAGINDTMFSGLSLSDINPATPTTGSLTLNTDYYFADVSLGSSATSIGSTFVTGTLNV